MTVTVGDATYSSPPLSLHLNFIRCRLLLTTFRLLFVSHLISAAAALFELSTTRYACFNTILEMSCDTGSADMTSRAGDLSDVTSRSAGSADLLLFEAAHYGRNDTDGAMLCHVPYTRNCDLDVQHPLATTCGGRQRCQLAINTAFFGDPCGYEEFLVVTYRCVAAELTEQSCSSSPLPVSQPGYLSSPNYPAKYEMFSDCRWLLTVQRQQTIRVTLFDFELDVKTNGVCGDYLQVSAMSSQSAADLRPTMTLSTVRSRPTTHNGSVLFKDCGSVGLQVIDVPATAALVHFHSGQSSLTQRGFILLFTAVGVGCPLVPRQQAEASQFNVFYYFTEDILHANVTCKSGYHHPRHHQQQQQHHSQLHSHSNSQKHFHCVGTGWNDTFTRCTPLGSHRLTTASGSKLKVDEYNVVKVTESSPDVLYSEEQPRLSPWIFVCFVVVSAIVAVGVCTSILTAFYRHRQCMAAKQRKQQQQQQWHINNLQGSLDNNDVTLKSADGVYYDVDECAIYRSNGTAERTLRYSD